MNNGKFFVRWSGVVTNDSFTVYNGWVDLTKYAIFPPKFTDLLDETLDEFRIDLKACPIEYFEPNTIVTLELENTPDAVYTREQYDEIFARNSGLCYAVTYDENTHRITSKFKRYMLIASDYSQMDMKIKNSRGKNIYTHELMLIELTKVAENFIGDSISFTNALGNDYIGT